LVGDPHWSVNNIAKRKKTATALQPLKLKLFGKSKSSFQIEGTATAVTKIES